MKNPIFDLFRHPEKSKFFMERDKLGQKMIPTGRLSPQSFLQTLYIMTLWLSLVKTSFSLSPPKLTSKNVGVVKLLM